MHYVQETFITRPALFSTRKEWTQLQIAKWFHHPNNAGHEGETGGLFYPNEEVIK